LSNIRFIYKGPYQLTSYDEKFITKLVNLVKQFHILPDDIEIQFQNMNNNVYGMTMVDVRFPNRICLNHTLSLEELILPLTHELLHLHQVFTKKLQCRSGGRIFYNGKLYKVDDATLSYEDYQNLPWEQDVNIKQKTLLEFITENIRKN